MKELIIGRNAVSGQLCVQFNDSTKNYGEKDCVYRSIRRKHANLSFGNSSEIILKSIKRLLCVWQKRVIIAMREVGIFIIL